MTTFWKIASALGVLVVGLILYMAGSSIYARVTHEPQIFDAKVIGVWYRGNHTQHFVTLWLPDGKVRDVEVTSGLGFALECGDRVFGTISYGGSYEVDGLRSRKGLAWADCDDKKAQVAQK